MPALRYEFNVFTGELDVVRARGSSSLVGENVDAGDVLTLDLATGSLLRASATFSLNKWRVSTVAVSSTLAGGSITLASPGDILPMTFSSAPAAVANGQHVFLSENLGEVALTPPLTSGTVVHVVGILKGADGVSSTPDVLFLPQYIARRP